jgi:hypothetical protein
MRVTRRKILRHAHEQSVRRRIESRDGVLWSIDSDSNCRVKIQGSNELVTAHFPRNQKARPSWLRVGNAVRISHRGGVRGYIEVSGQGRAIPQPVLGGALPTPGSTANGIITGMVVSETTPPTNNVVVAPGTYRINEIIYSFNGFEIGWPMMAEPTMEMGFAPATQMGDVGFNLEAAPTTGYFRYDLVVVGADQVIDYVTGTPTTSNPPMPAIPSDHILVRHILRVAGDTTIPDERIGAYWTTPKATSVTLTYTSLFAWSTTNDYPETNIVATVLDQYGRVISAPSGGWRVVCQKVLGAGKVYSAYSGYSETEVETSLFGGSTTFKYQRDQTTTEIRPYMMVTVECQPPLRAFVLGMILGFQVT